MLEHRFFNKLLVLLCHKVGTSLIFVGQDSISS
jgi:hypothetical protein